MNRYPIHTLPYITLAIASLLACAHRAPQSQATAAPPPPAPPPPPPSQGVVTRAPLPRSSFRADMARQEATSLDQLLGGRLAGVDVMPAPGGGVIVRLQTPTSLIAKQAPLFVVDGVPVETDGTLSWLDPHDIEFIQALKDPSETAIYGVRGSSGVILIRTKGSH